MDKDSDRAVSGYTSQLESCTNQLDICTNTATNGIIAISEGVQASFGKGKFRMTVLMAVRITMIAKMMGGF